MIRAFITALIFALVAFLASYAFRQYAISRRWSMNPRVWPGVIFVFVWTFAITYAFVDHS